MSDSKDAQFLKLLEKSIREVLNDTTITTKEKLAAIQVGAALVEKQNKLKQPKSNKFFKG